MTRAFPVAPEGPPARSNNNGERSEHKQRGLGISPGLIDELCWAFERVNPLEHLTMRATPQVFVCLSVYIWLCRAPPGCRPMPSPRPVAVAQTGWLLDRDGLLNRTSSSICNTTSPPNMNKEHCGVSGPIGSGPSGVIGEYQLAKRPSRSMILIRLRSLSIASEMFASLRNT